MRVLAIGRNARQGKLEKVAHKRLTEIGVTGVQQACQAWRASRGVTRSFILISVDDHRISVFKLLDVHVMFVDETFNVDTFRYRCLDVEKPCCRSSILGIFPSRLHQPRQNLVSVILKYLIGIKIKFRAIGHQAGLFGRHFKH